MALVRINPDAVCQSVAVIIAAPDPMKAKPKVAHITRHPLDIPVEMPDDLATALKAEKSTDKDGNEVPAVIDYVAPAPEAAAAAHGSGDMTAADLEKAGKKQAK